MDAASYDASSATPVECCHACSGNAVGFLSAEVISLWLEGGGLVQTRLLIVGRDMVSEIVADPP